MNSQQPTSSINTPLIKCSPRVEENLEEYAELIKMFHTNGSSNQPESATSNNKSHKV